MGRPRNGLRARAVGGRAAAMLGAAVASAAAFVPAAARADVIAIGDDGSVVTSSRPAVYLTPDLEPRPIVPERAASGSLASPAMARAQDRAAVDVMAAIGDASLRHGLDPALPTAVAWRESRFNASARSPKGASGVMQIMPATARFLGLDPADVRSNIEGGVTYLAMMLRRYDGDLVKALAAYNAGPAAVDRYGGVPPYRETSAYVGAILDRLSNSALASAR